VPGPEHPHYRPMLDELRRIFQADQNEGKIDFEYQTLIYFGQLD
jgi:hypothetical protein